MAHPFCQLLQPPLEPASRSWRGACSRRPAGLRPAVPQGSALGTAGRPVELVGGVPGTVPTPWPARSFAGSRSRRPPGYPGTLAAYPACCTSGWSGARPQRLADSTKIAVSGSATYRWASVRLACTAREHRRPMADRTPRARKYSARRGRQKAAERCRCA